ncbi:POZ domain-containing protein [Conidiobolus coronatus NRRL 28638]|uniref:Elongin-C n=1 Tax=Conidiobolus coronatus (strain ATCC 28846 / CBS 209.66 / NRRL 28638) TaxID=796925 RepID=A0A137PGV3_CONC2|nr:POZ domain-containing protein [Conidiobolus coronatus NRRL 28638]|eukprot:KXN74205.1 POZ domain-containing protein [Conidiobolus coronatus NRRL 28638]
MNPADLDTDVQVKLVSSDGFEFVIPKTVAHGSSTIQSMLDTSAQFQESFDNRIEFPEIKGIVLDKVCCYLFYKYKYSRATPTDLTNFHIDPQIALELMMAANYLDL